MAQQDDELVVEDVTQYAGFRQLLKRLEAVVAKSVRQFYVALCLRLRLVGNLAVFSAVELLEELLHDL